MSRNNWNMNDTKYAPSATFDYNNPMMPPPPYPGIDSNALPLTAPITQNPAQNPAYPGTNPNINRVGLSSGQNFYWGQFSTFGLDLLTNKNKLTVTKVFDMEEAATYIDKPRRFAVTTDGMTLLLSMIEDEAQMRTHVHHRSFEMNAMDPTGAKVFTIIREDTNMCSYCCFCCAACDCCKAIIKVNINDRTIGTIKQNCSFHRPSFTIHRDDDDDEWVYIDGGSALCNPATNYELRDAKSYGGSGRIEKTGMRFGSFSNNYNVDFPSQSTTETKVMCLAAVVLIDFRFFNPARLGKS